MYVLGGAILREGTGTDTRSLVVTVDNLLGSVYFVRTKYAI
jgi:hypothetical protein